MGVPFGFRSLDEWTGGIQPHEFVSVAGFSGLGQVHAADGARLQHVAQGFTPMFVSLEMEAKAILRRFDAMSTGIDYWRLKHLDLPEVGLKPGARPLKRFRHRPATSRSSTRSGAATRPRLRRDGPPQARRRVPRLHRPDAVHTSPEPRRIDVADAHRDHPRPQAERAHAGHPHRGRRSDQPLGGQGWGGAGQRRSLDLDHPRP